MRHGEVAYFDETGQPVAPDDVALTAHGREQARAAAEALAGVAFDRVLSSGLPRTVETARIVAGREPETWPELREIQGADLRAIPEDELEHAFVGAFSGVVPNDARFLGGESYGELFDRVLPALERLLADASWDTALAVLHGAVNRAILSYALTAERMFLGHFEQAPGVHQRARRRGRVDRARRQPRAVRPHPRRRPGDDDGGLLGAVPAVPRTERLAHRPLNPILVAAGRPSAT